MKETPAERLATARREAGFEKPTDAARAHGWKEPTYLGHENGSRGITPDVAQMYGRAFGVHPGWIIWGGPRDASSPATIAPPDDILVPVYDVEASAGHGAVVEHESIADQLRFPPNYLNHLTSSHPRHLAIVSVKGDSMSPTLNDDDIVMLDRSKTNLGYDGLFAVEMDGTLHVKRITRGPREGTITIRSDNEHRYPPYERSLADVRPVGKVIWAGRKE